MKGTVMDKFAPYWKAVVGFVTPGVVALVAAVQDASPGGSAVTGPEWVGIAAACIITGGAVFTVPNRDPKGTHQDESTQPPTYKPGTFSTDLDREAIERLARFVARTSRREARWGEGV